MRNRKTIMGFGLLAAVLFLAVGYAAISNIDFTITGTASAEVDTGLFEVAFDKNVEKTTTSNTGTTATVTANVTGDQSAEFVVSGLKAKNETVTATYTIVNSSEDLDAELSNPTVTLSGDNTSFYDVTAVYGNGSDETPLLEAGDSIKLTVTVKMKKTPIDSVNDVKSATIIISFSAEPVQPGSSSSGGSSSGGIVETDAPVYYGKHYFATNGGISTSIVFNQNGSAEVYEDCLKDEAMSMPAGAVEIIDQQIIAGGILFGSVSTDKNSLIINYPNGPTYEFNLSGDGTCVNPYTNLPMIAPRSTINSIMVFNNIYPKDIKSITLETTINVPEGIETFDLSTGRNGKVIGYVTPNAEDSNYYDLHIEGAGGLYAPVNSMNLFADLTSLTEINNLNKLDTSKVVDMKQMFNNSPLTTLDLSNFDTSNVIYMEAMFLNTKKLTSLDLSSFNTSNVINMSFMFGNANELININLGENFDTSKVTDMYYMFGNANNLKNLYLGNKFDTRKVTDMSRMFYSLSYLSSLDLGNKFDTSNVTNMSDMFFGVGSSNSAFTLNLGDKFDTSKVTDMNYMFAYVGKSNPDFTLNLGSKFNTGNVTDMSYMFYQTGKNSNKFTLDCSEWNVDKVTLYTKFNGDVDTKVTAPTWKN